MVSTHREGCISLGHEPREPLVRLIHDLTGRRIDLVAFTSSLPIGQVFGGVTALGNRLRWFIPLAGVDETNVACSGGR